MNVTAEQLRALLTYDATTGKLWWSAPRQKIVVGREAGTVTKYGYRRVHIYGRWIMAHRIAWMLTHGRWPVAELDHINGDRLDNRLCNLREASHSLNQVNRRRTNATGFRGVYKHKNKWRAIVRKDRIIYRLGSFETPELAHKAYVEAAQRFHGEFARAE